MATKLSIKSRIYPILYLKGYVSDTFFYLFVNSQGLSKHVNHNIVYMIRKKYLQQKERWGIQRIQDQMTLDNIYKYNFNKLLLTTLIISDTSHIPTLNSYPNMNIETYMDKYYIRGQIDEDLSIIRKINAQVQRVDDYSKIMKQIFKFKNGLFKSLNNICLNYVFQVLIKMEPNIGFIYINPFPGYRLYDYIKNVEIYHQEILYDNENNSEEYSDDDDFKPYGESDKNMEVNMEVDMLEDDDYCY